MINNNFKNLKPLAHPPLSAETLIGHGFSTSERPIFGGKNCRHNKQNVMLNSFQHLMPVNPGDKEIPKQVRNDKLYNATHCKSKFAFTLAEVLITLVIIGVVAALTIPNLMQKYTEQTTVKKLQKFYSTLSNAYSLAMKENGPASGWGVTYDSAGATKIYNLLFKPYFKVAKNCETTNTGKCIQNHSHKLLNGDSDYDWFGAINRYYKIILDDNSSIWFTGGTDGTQGRIYYDVNGSKEPNQFGRDLFQFIIRNDGIFPNGMPQGPYYYSSFEWHCLKPPSGTRTGWGCAAWVIYKGNMDYLHCNDLSWTGKDKCK